MFNPNLAQREKQIDRQEAMARAERSRLANRARGGRSPWGWRLKTWIAALLRSVGCSLIQRQLAVRFQSLIASRFRLADGVGAVFYQRLDALAPCKDETRG
jgi:hypothetical protein